MNKLFSTFRTGFFAMITLGFLALTSQAQALTLNVVGGQLLGASGVNVGGTLYDVEFLDGTCVALFNGCDSVTDFTFQAQPDAFSAVQVLFDEVFIDSTFGQFRSDPSSINGISGPSAIIFMPYAFNSTAASLTSAAVVIIPASNVAGVFPGSVSFFNDLTNSPESTYARFTAVPLSVVPLPPAGVLFGSGLVFLALLRRRAKKLAHA